MTRPRPILALAALLLAAGPAMAQAPTKVRVGYVPVIGASAMFVLDGMGWSKEAGLDLAVTKFDSGPAAIQALVSGTLDVLAIGIAPVAVAHAKGLDVKVVAALSTGGSAFVASSALAAAFAEAGNDPAKALAAFRQKEKRPAKLATLPPGATPTVALNYWLKTGKADAADYTIAQMGIDAVQQAMLAGAIDGGTVLEPALTIVLARDPKLKMIASAPEMFPNIPGVVVAVTGAFARKEPAAVDNLVRLVVRANTMIKEKPQEAAAHVKSALGGGLVDDALLATAMRSSTIGYPSDPRAIAAATKAMLDFQVTLGDFDKAPSTEGLFDTATFDRAVKK